MAMYSLVRSQVQTVANYYDIDLTTPSGGGNVTGTVNYTGTQNLNLAVGDIPCP